MKATTRRWALAFAALLGNASCAGRPDAGEAVREAIRELMGRISQ